jgi:hypothetical protein
MNLDLTVNKIATGDKFFCPLSSDKPPWLAATTKDENTHLRQVTMINVA